MGLSNLFLPAQAPDILIEQIQRSPGMPRILAYLRKAVPDVGVIPQTTYTRYREFERNGKRDGYQVPYYQKRAQLTRATLEMLLGDESMREVVHDLLWSICEETTWVLPAHEEQGPEFWDLKPSPRQQPWGAHTALTREPDAIDLFAAETGASLAEAVYLLGDRLAPEVVQRVRQEVERHIFKPYLAYGKRHWWFKGALNWNGVCNGAIGLAFARLEKDAQTLDEALGMVLEGFETYIATGFEADGGSIEGPGYWNYGLMYYVTLAELLRERSGGALDLLAQPRLRDIARYPLGMALAPGRYINFGDAVEQMAVEPGIVQRLAERTGLEDLRGLILSPERLEGMGAAAAKLSIILRDAAWWDGEEHAFPPAAREDFVLPACEVVKYTAQTSDGQPVVLAAKAGHNDGHHSHTDVGSFIYHLGGESLLCDPGRGLYSREYFRQSRYENIFNNSFGHSVPRIGGRLQEPGPEFGGQQQYRGRLLAHGDQGEKLAVIDMQPAYNLPDLQLARRTLSLEAESGTATLQDAFAFSDPTLQVEEAFVTWAEVVLEGSLARLCGAQAELELRIEEPAGTTFRAQRLEEDSRTNRREGILTRISVLLPPGEQGFRMQIIPLSAPVTGKA